MQHTRAAIDLYLRRGSFPTSSFEKHLDMRRRPNEKYVRYGKNSKRGWFDDICSRVGERERERERTGERKVRIFLFLSAHIRLADVEHQHEVTEPQVNIEQHIALATINCSIRFSFFASSVDRS